MSTKVIMPQMGESIFEGTITKWLKKVGEKIERDEPLFEISTDKVDSEIPSPASGILKEILVQEGSTVEINTVVAVIEGDGEAVAAAEEPAAEKKAGAEKEPKEAPAEEAPSKKEEPPKKEPPPEEAEKPAAPQAPARTPVPARDIRTSPLVRRIAREHGVELSRIEGTGLGGRITKQDILSYIDQRKGAAKEAEAPARPAAAAAREAAALPEAGKKPEAAPAYEAPKFTGETETVPMTTMRKSIAEHMVSSRKISAHVNTVFEVDMTSIVRLREAHKGDFEAREGVKLTYTPFIAKALVETVREFPIFNASVSGDAIVYKKPINLGIAVALEAGLIVPVVKDAHLKSFTGLVLAIHDLAERSRTKRLKPDDVQSGTITITNPGVYGGLFGTPIISQPQVAILGVGGIEKRPVVVDDAIAIRSMVYLSLTFDHRVIDGAVADQFMASLKNRLQSWTRWND